MLGYHAFDLGCLAIAQWEVFSLSVFITPGSDFGAFLRTITYFEHVL